ncbi:hypothetical protein BGZ50_000414 [Haplosporangium sp. Z 11]|nr:hypothetical protein BGZ50_000414 [Haplosporangium sp. Z 11]
MVSPRSPTSSFMSTLYGNSSHGSSKSPHTTVHSNYNVTISDFRTHSTIASTRSTPLPTKATDLVFDRRRGYQQQDMSSQNQATSTSTNASTAGSTITSSSPSEATTAVGATFDPVNKPSAHGSAGGVSALPSSHGKMGCGFRASLRSLDVLNLATSSSAPLRQPSTNNVTTTSSIPTTPTTPTFGFNESVESLPKQNKPRRGSEHSFTKDRSMSSSKHALSDWVPAALKAGFMNLRKKRPIPNHYLSLPVGGAASSPTNGMYMLHSEDLSVTEFAKLAGITILPERDDTTTFEDSMVGSESAIETNRELGNNVSGKDRQAARLGSASAGNTLHSFGSVASDGSNKKANIWDPQFWTMPAMPHTGESLTVHPTASSSSLPIPSGTSSLLQSPSSAAERAICIPDSKNKWYMSSGSGQGYSSSAPTRTSSTNTFPCPGSYHPNELPLTSGGPRRKSCFPFGSSRPSVGSGPEIDRMRLSSSATFKHVDQHAKPTKEAIQLSRDIGRPRSFASFTAIAMELDGKLEQSCNSGVKESGSTIDPLQHLQQQQQQYLQQIPQQHHAQPTIASVMPIQLEPSHPPRAITPLLPTQQPSYGHPAATLASQQSSRIKSGPPNRHCRPVSLRARSLNSSRTRSPSPSPLSRQIDVADSEELDSPQDETAQLGEQVSETPTMSSPGPPASRSQKQGFVHGRPDGTMSRTGASHALVNKHLASTKFQNRERTLPLSVSDQKLYQPSSTSSSSSSSLSLESQLQHRHQQQRVSPRPPCPAPPLHSCNLSPNATRMFTPGTKVGRFTLVQETCTKHVDMLQAQQQQRQRRASSGAEMSLGVNGAMDDRHSHTVGPIEGSAAAVAAMNPMLIPEENVVIFQRKKVRRLQQATPPTSSHKDIE